ncbi:hypothetical protein AOQ84DRAFT_155870 [Glonium stellatum]|uniref:Uncharacterized protein n=1 Tax=Glonium stellatum TaxID=574774 RepID=A0A8E2F874_9PEZI|nr:hypothetical protein AOQ84DRAFT_155870 [Glonium stellatum]
MSPSGPSSRSEGKQTSPTNSRFSPPIVAKALARRQLANLLLSSILSCPTVSSLVHTTSNYLQLPGGNRSKQRSVPPLLSCLDTWFFSVSHLSRPDKHTKYLRGRLAVVAPSKTIAPRHPVPDRIIIQRRRRQHHLEPPFPPAALLIW